MNMLIIKKREERKKAQVKQTKNAFFVTLSSYSWDLSIDFSKHHEVSYTNATLGPLMNLRKSWNIN